MTVPRLQLIGGGKMGEALLGGLVAAGWSIDDLGVAEKLEARADELRQAFPGLLVTGEPGPAQGHVLAVKPVDVPGVGRALAALEAGSGPRGVDGHDGPAPVLSIAAGVRIEQLEAALAPGTPVVRAMPNTAALVGAGAAAIAAGHEATDQHMAWAEEVLGAVGVVVRVAEPLLDAVTGVSGSGPAYVFLMAEALIEGGVLAGLPRPVARTLAVQTLLGSARLLAESPDGPEALRAAVTSPGGTTAAGLRALESHAVRSAFLDAVMAATERSRELGQG